MEVVDTISAVDNYFLIFFLAGLDHRGLSKMIDGCMTSKMIHMLDGHVKSRYRLFVDAI